MPRIRPAVLFALAAALPFASFAQIRTSGAQFWLQSSAGIDIPAQDDAYFGGALAAGDFNGDGFDDLAVGIPEYDLTGLFDVGLVLTMYGDENGPSAVGHDLWTQNNVLLLDAGEEGDTFGRTLAVGDFDNDGYADLAIGVPNEGIGTVAHAGAVQVLRGSPTGLSTVGNKFFYQGLGGGLIIGVPEENDRFGSTLAVGDFDHDGFDDLAVGVPYESVGAVANAGAFHVIFGSAGGLTTVGDRIFYLGNDMPGAPSSGDFLAWSLAAGDFDPEIPGDELAVGAPGSSVNGLIGAGAVWIVSNLDGGSTADELDLDSAGMPGEAEVFDQFGCALAAGQFDGIGGDDLAITACQRDVATTANAGVVYAYYFNTRPAVGLDQSSLPGEQPDEDDYFGIVLSAGDFDADGVDDLAIGVHFEDIAGEESAGTAHVLYGVQGGGLAKAGAQTFVQTMSPSEANDRFGQALVAGHFSGHSGVDLAIAAPWETYAGDNQAGAMNVFFSRTLFVDGFESADVDAWSSAVGGAV